MRTVNEAETPGIAQAIRAVEAVLPLAQRLHQAADAGAGQWSNEDASSQPDADLPGMDSSAEEEAIEEMMRDWARQAFVEKLFFGEEEENGLPPLSIDI